MVAGLKGFSTGVEARYVGGNWINEVGLEDLMNLNAGSALLKIPIKTVTFA